VQRSTAPDRQRVLLGQRVRAEENLFSAVKVACACQPAKDDQCFARYVYLAAPFSGRQCSPREVPGILHAALVDRHVCCQRGDARLERPRDIQLAGLFQMLTGLGETRSGDGSLRDREMHSGGAQRRRPTAREDGEQRFSDLKDPIVLARV
jgi:hypothetical protein